MENSAIFKFLRCQIASESVKENMLQTSCFQELQDGTGMDYARSAWKLLHIKAGLSPFLLMNMFLSLHYYSCTATTLSCHFRNIEIDSNNGSRLESLDAIGPGRKTDIKTMCTRWLTAKR